MVGPGSALRSVHPLPPSLSCHDPGRHICANVLQTPPPLGLERSNDPPPAPSQVPSPGKRTRVQRDRLVSICGPSKDVAFPLPLAALRGSPSFKSAVLQCQRFGEQPGERLQPSGFPTGSRIPRNRNRVLAVARDLRRPFAERDLAESPTASSCLVSQFHLFNGQGEL